MYIRSKEKNTVTLPHSAQRKHAFLGEIEEISKTKKCYLERKLLSNCYIKDYFRKTLAIKSPVTVQVTVR